MDPSYLGDGVYVSLDSSGQVVLTTGDHRPGLADNVIYLEPEVRDALRRYIDKLDQNSSEMEGK